MEPIWILIDLSGATPGERSAMRAEAEAVHKANGVGELSVTFNVAGTQALVKVLGGTLEDVMGSAWAGNVLATYTRETLKSDFLPVFYTSAWQAPDPL